jgi:Chlorophyll A-B binding protein
MKTAILATLIASAAAFAPAKDASRSTALNMAFENELGAQAPLGFYDPFGIVEGADQARFDRLRYVEIKHGRICMLGVVGYLLNAAGVYLPGDIDYAGTKFSDLGYGWAASTAVPVAGALQVFAFVGLLELGVMKSLPGKGNEHIGDFRNGALDFGWDKFSPAEKLQKRAVELNQGRAAQMGMLGLMVHDKLGNVEDFFFPAK